MDSPSQSQNPIQNTESEASPAITSSLRNPLVLKKIFKYLSNVDLLNFALVNKLWNYEARTEIRKRGNIIASLECDDNHACPDRLEAFGVLLQQMNVIPFSGISFRISLLGETCQTAAWNRINEHILDRLQFKTVSIFLGGESLGYKDCLTFLLAKKVLQDFGDVLEELSLHIHNNEQQDYIQDVVQESRFPLLKVLKLREIYHTLEAANLDDMMEMVSRAPRLQELHIEGWTPISSVVYALAGRSVVIVWISKVRDPLNEIPEAAISSLRLIEMELFYMCPLFNLERFSRIAPALLQSCCATTLRSIWIDAVLAVPLMCYRISLENVKDLEMHMQYRVLEQLEPRILRIVKHFDFTHIFPNLNKVQICGMIPFNFSRDHMNTIIEQADAVLTVPTSDRAANIKELCLDRCNFTNINAQFFAEMFPNLEKLEVETAWDESVPFGSIWKHWVDLNELEVRGNVTHNNENLDSVFCGISPEEVAELREKDEEYLKRVQIVPVMPAITCLKNLRVLTHNRRNFLGAFADDATFTFSKVTVWIALARCPTLGFNST